MKLAPQGLRPPVAAVVGSEEWLLVTGGWWGDH